MSDALHGGELAGSASVPSERRAQAGDGPGEGRDRPARSDREQDRGATQRDGTLGVDREVGRGRRQDGQQVERDGRGSDQDRLAGTLGRRERDDRDEQRRGRPEVAGSEDGGRDRDVEDREREPAERDHRSLAGGRAEMRSDDRGDGLRGQELAADREQSRGVGTVADRRDREGRGDDAQGKQRVRIGPDATDHPVPDQWPAARALRGQGQAKRGHGGTIAVRGCAGPRDGGPEGCHPIAVLESRIDPATRTSGRSSAGHGLN